MKAQPPRLYRDADEYTETELIAARVLAGLGVFLILLFGPIHRTADPRAVDPMWLRGVMAGICAGIAVASYTLKRRAFIRALEFGFYAVTLWVLWLVVANDFSKEYSLAFVVVMGAIGASFDNRTRLVIYYIVHLALLTAFGLLEPSPEVSLVVYLPYAFMMGGLSFLGLNARLRSREQHAASEARYALAAYGANDGLWDWDVVRDRLEVSDRWHEMVGGKVPGTTLNSLWLSRVHEEDQPTVAGELEACRTGKHSHMSVEYRMLHAEGRYVWMLARGAAVFNEDGQCIRMAGSQSDITLRKQAEERLLYDAMHDTLTSLPNRALLRDRLDRLMAQARRRHEYRFAVVFLDLDRFKLVNDGMGHDTGDRLLIAVARRLEGVLRSGDTLARLGGDEFVIVLVDLDDAGEAMRIAQRINDALQQPYMINDATLFTSAGIGVTLASDRYATTEELLRDADIAMYRAKALGTGSIQLFDEAMHNQAVRRLMVESELRGAIERGEFVLRYQPIIDLGTGRIAGFEALVRWAHPTRGVLEPDEFLNAAEETGLIIQIGQWVLREACRKAIEWQFYDEGVHRYVAVNFSTRQFSNEGITAEVMATLEETGLPPHLLRVELTETTFMTQAQVAAAALTALRSNGVGVAIDDFGTGYSALSYVHRLAADTLKIDRSFVSTMVAGGKDTELVRAIVTLAHNAGLDTVAEGVETTAQLEALLELGCRFGQGFLFSVPVDANTAKAMLQQRSHFFPSLAKSRR